MIEKNELNQTDNVFMNKLIVFSTVSASFDTSKDAKQRFDQEAKNIEPTSDFKEYNPKNHHNKETKNCGTERESQQGRFAHQKRAR